MSDNTKPEIAAGQTWVKGSLRVKILSVSDDGRVFFSSTLHPAQAMHVSDFQAWIKSTQALLQDGTGWLKQGSLVYILTESVTYRGRPTMENEFTIRVEPGRGRNAADAEALAEKIQHLLNSEL